MTDDAASLRAGPLSRATKRFERVIVVTLVVLLMAVIGLSVLDLAWMVAKNVLKPPYVLVEVEQLLEIFGAFLLILIGVELLETVKAYLQHNVVHLAIVLDVALIASARKIIVLDLDKYDGLQLLAFAALMIALAAARFFDWHVRRSADSWAKVAAVNPHDLGAGPSRQRSVVARGAAALRRRHRSSVLRAISRCSVGPAGRGGRAGAFRRLRRVRATSPAS